MRVGKLWSAVAAGDEYSALDTVRNALDAGLDSEAILLDVIGTVQHRVGVEWAANRTSVAEEHGATAINDRAVASLPQHRAETVRGRITVACVDREWHAMPARLLAEVLRLRGWHVDCLGAQVPSAHLIAHLHRTGADVVALSGSLPTRLPTAHAVITACQSAGTPVIVGGAAFGPGGRYARRLGARGWAPDARAAADRLAQGLPLPDGARRATATLPHLLDQEYTLVKRNARQLVRGTFTGLADRHPAMGVQRRAAWTHRGGPGAHRRLPRRRPLRRRHRAVHRLRDLDRRHPHRPKGVRCRTPARPGSPA
ncbi:hypothetical protein GCM10010274_60020 [Streptomyces lavendofoliae]|uniref:B12-binding domain-containing protein n=1 Tax=Streptomyces lavendofoliae TaxID=67314 RepID=A0A918I3H2_9ACTN|nr:hypothetical protein GCM10010274_60020 [Streptomyces lavendofoliae]